LHFKEKENVYEPVGDRKDTKEDKKNNYWNKEQTLN
jgi:hypothetical protein